MHFNLLFDLKLNVDTYGIPNKPFSTFDCDGKVYFQGWSWRRDISNSIFVNGVLDTETFVWRDFPEMKDDGQKCDVLRAAYEK